MPTLLFGRSPEDKFADRVMRLLRARRWPDRVSYDRASFTLEVGGPVGDFYLGNVFREWSAAARADRARIVEKAVSALFEAPDHLRWEETAPKLVPMVRNLAQLQAQALMRHDGSPEIWQPFTPLSENLGVIVAIDLPNSTALVSKQQLAAWGVSFETAFQQALENLIPKSPVRFEAHPGGFLTSAYGDTYDSSRLVMPELFHALQLDGAPVAVALTRSCVAVAGSRDTAALSAMADFVVQTLTTEARPTAYTPHILEGEVWRGFRSDDPELSCLHALHLRQDLWDYGPQETLLADYLEAQGEDVFVAPYDVAGSEVAPWSFTTWAEGVPVRLPRSDFIGMVARDGHSLTRRRRDIEAVCGVFLEDRSLYPMRLTPPAWPTPAQWARLRDDFEAHELDQPEPQPEVVAAFGEADA